MMERGVIKNILRGFSQRLVNSFYNKYKKIGLNWVKSKEFKNIPEYETKFPLFGSLVYFTNKNELFHAIDEIFIDEIYKCELPENALIIDCGANMGFSVLYFKQNHPKAQIIAFEPDEKNIFFMESNILSFNLKNIEIIKKAVWIEDGFISFINEGSMSSKIEVSFNGSNGNSKDKNLVKVPCVRLKNYLDRKVHFLKIDIEGAEYEVLKDCQDRLGNVGNLFIEYHGSFGNEHELLEILSILNKSNFKIYIKEANNNYTTPFYRNSSSISYDIQLNLFAFRI